MSLIRPPWKSLITSLPADSTEVWVKMIVYGQNAKATWNTTLQVFTLSDTGLILPWYMVFSWKPI